MSVWYWVAIAAFAIGLVSALLLLLSTLRRANRP